MSAYPEHEKLAKIQEQSQKCGEFLEWLGENGYFLCVRETITEEPGRLYWPTSTRVSGILARFFDIDEDKLEKEKRAMLAAHREAHP